MSKKDTKKILLTDSDRKLLKKLTDDITQEAKLLVEDYAKHPSKESGSMVIVHQDAPVLKDNKDKDNKNDKD
tara:strand:- start:458 stop:673 length:216 start_codon:yes stop_codon:yes gene_type:complete